MLLDKQLRVEESPIPDDESGVRSWVCDSDDEVRIDERELEDVEVGRACPSPEDDVGPVLV